MSLLDGIGGVLKGSWEVLVFVGTYNLLECSWAVLRHEWEEPMGGLDTSSRNLGVQSGSATCRKHADRNLTVRYGVELIP